MKQLSRQNYVFLVSIALAIFTLFAGSTGPAFSQVNDSGGLHLQGDVHYDNGTNAADGMIVRAYIGGVEVAKTFVENGRYDFTIPNDNLGTPQREGGVNGELISFEVYDPNENMLDSYLRKALSPMPQIPFESNSSKELDFKVVMPVFTSEVESILGAGVAGVA